MALIKPERSSRLFSGVDGDGLLTVIKPANPQFNVAAEQGKKITAVPVCPPGHRPKWKEIWPFNDMSPDLTIDFT
jgi:hypothetical protein